MEYEQLDHQPYLAYITFLRKTKECEIDHFAAQNLELKNGLIQKVHLSKSKIS